MTELFETGRRPRPAAGRAAAAGCSRRSTGPGCSRPPTSTSPRGSRRSAARPTSRSLLAVALAVRAVRRGSVCVDLAEVAAARRPELPWPDPSGWLARAVAAGPLAAASVVRGRGRDCSTSTATGARRARSATTCSRAPAAAPAGRRGRCLAAGAARIFPARVRRAARRRPRGRAASGPPCSPAAPAPARRPPSPACWPCSPSRRAGGSAAGRAGRAHRQGGRPAAGGRRAGPPPTLPADGPSARGPARRDHPAPAARAADPTTHPVPPRPRQPAAARRRGRRRDVDGVADDDGPAGRGGPARRPAGAGRRPRPARLGRGRRRARRPGRRARGSPTTRTVAALRTSHRFGARIGALAAARARRRRGPGLAPC